MSKQSWDIGCNFNVKAVCDTTNNENKKCEQAIFFVFATLFISETKKLIV